MSYTEHLAGEAEGLHRASSVKLALVSPREGEHTRAQDRVLPIPDRRGSHTHRTIKSHQILMLTSFFFQQRRTLKAFGALDYCYYWALQITVLLYVS